MRILHILSQRPGLSGSGVFFNALVREALNQGMEQHAIVAGPPETEHTEVPGLGPGKFSLIPFPSPRAPFPVPGNSDLMPYPSSVFSRMTEREIEQYLGTSRKILRQVKKTFQPDIVHAHHLWLMTALARQVFQDKVMIATAHNSEIRQLVKAPHLAPRVLPGIRALDKIGVLTPQSRLDTVENFGVAPENLVVTGAGFRPDLFQLSEEPRKALLEDLGNRFGIHLPSLQERGSDRLICFAGRLSSPKGIPFLLKAFERLRRVEGSRIYLVLIGAPGPSEDGKRLQRLAVTAGPSVQAVGAIPQEAVARIFQASDLFVLPSLFEGLPLVMLEALACGLPCVVSGLPTIKSWVPEEWVSDGQVRFVPRLGTTLADCPLESDVPRFAADLTAAMLDSLKCLPGSETRRRWSERLNKHTWAVVFERYLQCYGARGVA